MIRKFKNLKIKYKIAIPIVLVSLAIFTIKIHITVNSLNTTFRNSTHNLVESKVNEVNYLFEEYCNMALYSAIVCSKMKIIKDTYGEYYKTGDFERTSQAIKNEFQKINQAILKNTSYEPRIHFHLPPAISFCRTWSNVRGDTITDFRNSVLEVSKTHTPSKVIEIGRGGYVIRGIAPIFSDSEEYYGSVEVFFNIDIIIEAVSIRMDEDFAIFMKSDFLDIATNFLEDSSTNISLKDSTIKDYVLVNHTKKFKLENISKNTSNLKSNHQIFQVDNYKYAIIPIKSFNNETQGLGLLQVDISGQKEELGKMIISNIAEFFLLILGMIILISILCYEFFIKHIIKVDIALKRLSEGETIEKFSVSKKDEIGCMLNSLDQLNESIIQKVNFAVEIRKNNLETKYEPVGKYDILGQTMLEMQKELLKYRTELEKEVKDRTIELEESLSKLKNTQVQLVQSEKMASLGILTAGVAHEINNPLNYILGSYSGLEKYFKEHCINEEQVLNLLKYMKTGIDRAADIVKGLNQFSQCQERLDEVGDVHSIIDNCLVILNNQLQDRIEIENNYSEKSLQIIGNIGELHQLFLNILTNAINAIVENGSINIITKKIQRTVSIEISDTGCGINKENLPKVLDPFFTTKEPGEGTGLGLSIAYAIIKEHKGKLEFLSEKNKGTTVKILLPLK